MALTQVSTQGIKDGTITGSDLATNVDLADNQRLRFGDSADLRIFHDSTHSYISNLKNNTYIEAPNYVVISSTDTAGSNQEISARFLRNGNVELYHDNSKKFETTSSGISITGGITTSGASTFNEDVVFTGATRAITFDKSADALEFGDEMKATFGNSGDLAISHSGTASLIQEVGTGSLHITTNGTQITIDKGTTESMANFIADGAVELFYDNSKKFETHSGGVSVFGNLSLTNADSYELRLGASSDLKLLHNGTDSKITNTTGNLIITQSDGIIRLDPKTNENGILIRPGGATELYFNNSLRLLTTANGVTLDHNLLLDNATNAGRDVKWDPSNDQLIWNDSTKACFGDSADLQIFHEGHSVIKNTHSSAAFLIASHATHMVNAALTENIAKFKEGSGGVELYHSNSIKLSTFSSGIITQHVQPDNDNDHDVGSSSKRFDNIHATNGTIQTSDKNEKENILTSDLGLDFINKLKPISFKFKGKTRTHYGLIAQDIETLITDLGKTTNEFAPLIKETIEDGTERYGLRYTELLSPLIKAIQELSAEVAALKAS